MLDARAADVGAIATVEHQRHLVSTRTAERATAFVTFTCFLCHCMLLLSLSKNVVDKAILLSLCGCEPEVTLCVLLNLLIWST